MSAKFFQFKKNLFITILLLVIFVLPNNALAENLLTVGSANSNLTGTDSAIFSNIGSISATTTSLIRLQKNGVDLFKVDSTGNVTMGNFLTSISAANVSSGAFGSLSGNGNFSFPANVGIGTMTPAARLNIYSTSSIEEMFRLSDASGSSAANKYINWYSNNGGTTLTDFARIGAGYGSDYINSFMAFSVADSARVLRERVRINVNGNVGIGTTNPGAKLNVVGGDAMFGAGMGILISGENSRTSSPDGTSLSYILQTYATTGTYPYNEAGNLVLQGRNNRDITFMTGASSPSASMVINRGGNVGIGTTTPSAKLTVAGGNIFITDAVITSSTPHAAITKTYLDSALETLSSDLSASTTASNYWLANGANIYNKNTGNVGIGTTAPANKLDVALGSISIGSSNISNGLQSSLKIYSFDNGAQQLGTLAADYADSLRTVHLFGNSNTNQIKIDTSASNGRIILFPGTGNVGIGTTTPITPLNVIGKWQYNLAGTIYSQDNSFSLDLAGINVDSLKVYKDIYSTAGVLKTGGTGDNWLLGNVGIGTTTPGAKLDVFGSFRLSNLASSTSFTGLAISPNGDVGKISLSKSAVKEEAVYNVATTAYQTFMSSPSYVDNYHAKLRITTYATDSLISGNVMVVEVYGSKNYVPTVSVVATQNSTGASASGIQYFRVAYPSALNNGAPVHLEFNTASTANRYIKVEVLDSENLNLLPAVNGSLYTSSNQSVNTPLVYYNGTVTNKTIYGNVSGSAGSSAYSTYGSYAGFSASNGTDKTGLWAYIGEIYLAYSSTYRFGQSWNIELKIKENANNTSKPVNLFDDAQLILKGRMPVSTDANAFNTTIPEFSVELNGNNLELTKDDIAMMVASSNTSAKSVRLYVRLKSANTNYVFTPINRYGASYSSTGVISTGYCYFNSVTGAVGPLPSPASGQGSIVYAVQGENSNFWRSNNDNIFNLNTGNVGINTSTPGSLLAVGNNLGLTTGGIIFNSDSTRWLDMTGTNEDSLRLSKNIRLGDAARNVALGLGTNVPNRASLTLNSTAGNPADIIFKNGSATIGNYGQWAISSRNGSSDYRFSIWRGSENGGVSTESEMFTISPSGNVGIGTTNSSSRLEIAGPAYDESYLRFSVAGNPTFYSQIKMDGAKNQTMIVDIDPLANSTYNSFAVNLSSTTAFYIDRFRNVGIGTTTPDAKLNVNGNFHVSGAFSSVVFDKLADVSGSRIVMADSSGALYATSTSVATGLPSPSGISGQTLRSNGTSWVANNLLYNNGTNVGIGTAAPSQKLDVQGNIAIANNMIGGGKNYGNSGNSASAYLQLYDNSTGRTTLNNQVYAIDFQTATTSRLFITNGGNVGIGTTTPGSLLDLAGNFKITSGGLVYNTNSSYRFNFSDIFGDHNSLIVQGDLNSAGVLETTGTTRPNYMMGNLGIGVAVPVGQLEIATSSSVALNNSSLVNNYSLNLFQTNLFSGEGAGLAFTIFNGGNLSNSYTPGAAITFERVGNNSQGGLHFKVKGTAGATDALTDALSIKYDGKVGIGTTTPDAKLNVNGNFHVSGAFSSVVFDKLADVSGSRIVMADSSGALYATSTSVATGLPSPSGISGQTLRSNGTSWVANNLLYNNGTNVGIGNASPGARLDITGTEAHVSGDLGGTDALLRLYNDLGSDVAEKGAVITFEDKYLGTTRTTRAAIKGGTARAGNTADGFLSFYTDSDSANTMQERMRIIQNGNVGIGKTAPTQKLEVAGNIFMNTGYLMQTDTWGMKWKFAGDSDTVEMNSSELAWKFNIAGGGVTKYRFNSSKTGFGPILDLNTSGSSIFYGSVGIGTTTPNQKLEVSGGNIFITDASINSGTPHAAITKTYLDSALETYGSKWILNGSKLYASSTDWNVGIGTSNPQAKLDILKSSVAMTFATTPDQLAVLGVSGSEAFNLTSSYIDLGSNPRIGGLFIANTTSSNMPNIGVVGIGSARGGNNLGNSYGGVFSAVSTLNSGVNNNYGVYVKNVSGGTNYGIYVEPVVNNYFAGNVGIGTTTPSASLDIFGNFKITSGGLVYNTNSSYRFNFSDIFGDHNSLIAQGDFNTAGVLETAGTARPNYMMGNLGIGTTTPNSKLDIFSGNLELDAGYGLRSGNANVGVSFPVDNQLKLQSYSDLLFNGYNGSSYVTNMVIKQTSGNVGIGTTAPNAAYKLDVAGQINASGGLCMNGVCQTSWNVFPVYSTSTPLNLNGGNIINVRKLTVGTIDPLYRIDGTNYSSFAAAIVGGVKEEYLGRVKISQAKGKEYEYRLDFSKLSAPDELWVWRQTVDFSPENVEVNLTPYGAFANIYYIIENEAIIFRADKPVTVSYRLSGKRVDWQNWPTKAKDQQEKPSFIINKGKVIK